MPVRALAELQPVFGLLAGSPEAERIELTVVASRSLATEIRSRLRDAFDFYGLMGGLVVVGDKETPLGRLEAGAAASEAERLLVWTPAALPRSPGWLAALIAEADGLGDFGLLSPCLIHEDGAIAFAGERSEPPDVGGFCALAGFGAHAIPLGRPQPVSAGAPEIALIARPALKASGGFARRCFSEAYAQADLAARLRDAGFSVNCSGAVSFWSLDEPKVARPSPFVRLMQRVDAVLLGDGTRSGAEIK